MYVNQSHYVHNLFYLCTCLSAIMYVNQLHYVRNVITSRSGIPHITFGKMGLLKSTQLVNGTLLKNVKINN